MPLATRAAVVTGHAASDDDDPSAGATPGDAAHQDAAAAVAAHQVIGTDLGRQLARDLAHRGQQRQGAVQRSARFHRRSTVVPEASSASVQGFDAARCR